MEGKSHLRATMDNLTRAVVISVMGVALLFLSAGLSSCANGQSPAAVTTGNMSWDKKTYTIDESDPSSILAFIEFLSLGVGLTIPFDQLDESQKAFAVAGCSPAKPAGMTLNRQTGRITPTCMYKVSEAQFRASGSIPVLLQRGWKYQGKFGTKHVFVKMDGKNRA